MSEEKHDSVSYESWLTNSMDYFEQLSPEDQEKIVSLFYNKCNVKSRMKLRNEMTTVDFISELPIEVVEYVLDCLPLVDLLIACHVSQLWNK